MRTAQKRGFAAGEVAGRRQPQNTGQTPVFSQPIIGRNRKAASRNEICGLGAKAILHHLETTAHLHAGIAERLDNLQTIDCGDPGVER